MLDLKNFDFSKKVLFHPERLIEYKKNGRCFPLTLEIDLTNACNHKCNFCFYADSLNKKVDTAVSRKVPTAIVDRIEEVIRESSELGTKGVSFSGGGEPTAHKDYSRISLYAHNVGLSVGLITNGSLMERHADSIASSHQWVRVSMAGGDEQSYRKVQGVDDFNKVLNNIEMIRGKSSSLNVGIRMLVTDENYRTVPNLINRIAGLKLNYLQLAPDQFSKNLEFWERFLSSSVLKEATEGSSANGLDLLTTSYVNNNNTFSNNSQPIYCHAHFFQTVITAEGDLVYCKNSRGSKEKILGNIYHDNLVDIWNNEKTIALETNMTSGNCGLFCRCMALNQTVDQYLNPPTDMSLNHVT